MTRTVYCGVDFHARTQTVAFCDSSNGEVQIKLLDHQNDDLRQFYSHLPGKVIVGLESCGFSSWFEQLLEELGCEVWLGHASEVRRYANRRQKNDRRDAELILDLLVRGGFPRIHRRSPESTEVLRQLRYRHRLVRMTTMIKNSLQAMAIGGGMTQRSGLWSGTGRKRLEGLKVTAVQSRQRAEWLELLQTLEERIHGVEQWLGKRASSDAGLKRRGPQATRASCACRHIRG